MTKSTVIGGSHRATNGWALNRTGTSVASEPEQIAAWNQIRSLDSRALAKTATIMPIDSEDFGRAYECYYERTIRLLCSKGLRLEQAEEFAQLAWARAWERRAQLRNSCRLASWVNSIALNEFRTHLRRNGREQQIEEHDPPCEPTVLTQRLIDQLLQSNDRYGHILEYFYLFGYSAEEIAQLYKTTGVAIRVRLARGRAAIRPLLAPQTVS